MAMSLRRIVSVVLQNINVLSTNPSHRFLLACSCRCISTSGSKFADNQDYVISQVYHNRNPRNLEKLALARKRLGWQFQAPRRDYYHKLKIVQSHRHTEAVIEHSSGNIVLSASTKEWAIRNQLYSCTDVSASASVGRILAQRCLESGITSVFYDESDFAAASERVIALLQAFDEANISLTEPEMIVPEHGPGINYEGYNRLGEPKEWKEDYQDV